MLASLDLLLLVGLLEGRVQDARDTVVAFAGLSGHDWVKSIITEQIARIQLDGGGLLLLGAATH